MHCRATAVYELYRQHTYTVVPEADHELWHPNYLQGIKSALDRLTAYPAGGGSAPGLLQIPAVPVRTGLLHSSRRWYQSTAPTHGGHDENPQDHGAHLVGRSDPAYAGRERISPR